MITNVAMNGQPDDQVVVVVFVGAVIVTILPGCGDYIVCFWRASGRLRPSITSLGSPGHGHEVWETRCLSMFVLDPL